jgi:hypothetical protein
MDAQLYGDETEQGTPKWNILLLELQHSQKLVWLLFSKIRIVYRIFIFIGVGY